MKSEHPYVSLPCIPRGLREHGNDIGSPLSCAKLRLSDGILKKNIFPTTPRNSIARSINRFQSVESMVKNQKSWTNRTVHHIPVDWIQLPSRSPMTSATHPSWSCCTLNEMNWLSIRSGSIFHTSTPTEIQSGRESFSYSALRQVPYLVKLFVDIKNSSVAYRVA